MCVGIVNSSAGTPSVFLTGLRLGKSSVSSGSWVNDLAYGKDFKKVPEAARGLQGTELTTHTGLLCSLVGKREASRKRWGSDIICFSAHLGTLVSVSWVGDSQYIFQNT